MTGFNYITEEERIEIIKNSEKSTVVLLELTYQLKRIADSVQKQPFKPIVIPRTPMTK